MTRLLVVRHGLTEWNAAGRWQGWADAPLADVGRRQALDAAAAIGAVDAIVASDLSRALITAEIIGEAIGVGPVAVHPGLRERHVGAFEGLTTDEIKERFPGALDRSPVEPPGAEAVETLEARVVAALVGVAATVGDGDVLVVSHGGVIRQLDRRFGIAPELVPNLGGRWIDVEGDRLTPGERVLLLDPHDVPITVPREE